MLTLGQQYAIACAPGPGPDGGLRLRQATVGHYSLLCRLESPLISNPREIGPGDLALALWVLRRPWTKAQKRVGNSSTRWRLKYRSRVYHDDNHAKLTDLCCLLNYWRYHTVGLQCWEQDGNEETIPAVFSIQYALAQLGMNHSEIFDHPLKGALAALTALNALNDPSTPLMDNAAMSYMENARRRRAEATTKENG